MRQLTASDVQYLLRERGNAHAHMGSVVVCRPREHAIDRQTVEALLRRRLHLLAPFRWRLLHAPLGNPYWEEVPDVDLDLHVGELTLPAPGDDRQLAEALAAEHSRPLDLTRPPWEMRLIHGLEGGRIGLLAKVHHAALDGVSAMSLWSALLDDTPRARPDEPDERPGREPRPSRWMLLGRALAAIPGDRLRALRAVPRVLPHLDQVPALRGVPGARLLSAAAARRLPGGGGLPPRTGLSGPLSPERRVVLGSFPLHRVRELAGNAGLTINDVVIALAAGALRRRLLARGALPDDPIVALVPVSRHDSSGGPALGNRFTYAFPALPTHVADPGERLAHAGRSMRRAKARARDAPATLLEDVYRLLSPALLARASRLSGRFGSPPANVVVSNLAGPSQPLYLCGSRVEALYPLSQLPPGMGLCIMVVGYVDRLHLGLVGDRDLLPDISSLMEDLHSELDELTALGRPSARACNGASRPERVRRE